MSKRFQKSRPQEPQFASRRPSVPPETAAQLFHIGSRARKHVSDGHLTQSSYPISYQPGQPHQAAPPPVYDRGEFRDLRQKSDLQLRAERGSVREPTKRQRPHHDDDDLGDTDDDGAGTDVDEDEGMMPEKPQSFNSIKAFYVPPNYQADQQMEQDNEFEEATFLRPMPPGP